MHICQPHNQCYWLIFVQCTCAHLCAFESMLMRIENGAKLGRNPDLRSPGLFNPPLLTKHTHTLIGFIPEQAQRGMWGEDLSMALWGLKAPPLLFCTHFGNCANRARVCVFLVAAIPPNELHCTGLLTPAHCSRIKNSITSIPVFLEGGGSTDTHELLMLQIGFCLHLYFSPSLPNISLSFSIATVDWPNSCPSSAYI